MTPRQARTERRTAERKAKKAELRRNKQASLELHDDELPLEEEFSAELMAEANAMRERVHRRAALSLAAHDIGQGLDQSRDCKGAVTTPGFVSQPTLQPPHRRPLRSAKHEFNVGPKSIVKTLNTVPVRSRPRASWLRLAIPLNTDSPPAKSSSPAKTSPPSKPSSLLSSMSTNPPVPPKNSWSTKWPNLIGWHNALSAFKTNASGMKASMTSAYPYTCAITPPTSAPSIKHSVRS